MNATAFLNLLDQFLASPVCKDWDESQHPRAESGTPEGGQFISGGGTGAVDAVHWTTPITAPDGTTAYTRQTPFVTSNIELAVVMLRSGYVVELKDTRQVFTLLSRLAQIAQEAKAEGRAAHNYDLCKVTIAGTNLFCAERMLSREYPRGVPRIEMPQLSGAPVAGTASMGFPRSATNPAEVNGARPFIDYVKTLGFPVSEGTTPASKLKASQAELVGTKVGGMMRSTDYNPATEPIFISRDSYILDGHHRWAAVVGRDAEDGHFGDSTMNVVRIDAPISELLPLAKAWSAKVGLAGKAAKRWISKDYEESLHPRDERGRWTDASGLPADVTVNPRLTVTEVLDGAGHWKLTLIKSDDHYGAQARHTLRMEPRGEQVGYTRLDRPDEIYWYDPTKSHLEVSEWTKQPEPVLNAEFQDQWNVPAKAEAGTLFRGMSAIEYRQAQARGYFESSGLYNFSNQQRVTLFSTDPEQARAYAAGFAPWPYVPTGSNPGMIVAVRTQNPLVSEATIPGTERAVSGRIPFSAVTAVYEGKPWMMRSATVDLIPTGRADYTYTEGSRSSPSASVLWTKLDHATIAKEWDESLHPREPGGSSEGGRFTSGGGGGPLLLEGPRLDPAVVAVSGDEWNRQAALRLESEYQAAKPEIETLIRDIQDRGPAVTSIVTSGPQEWDELSGSLQESAEKDFVKSNWDSYYDSEVENWRENDALTRAAEVVAEDQDWIAEQVQDWMDSTASFQGDEVSAEDLAGTITITTNEEWGSNADAQLDEITFDDAKLQAIDPSYNPNQLALPGTEPTDYSKLLTPEMREDLMQTIKDNWAHAVEREADRLDPPDYLGESVSESLKDSWDQMSDKGKFDYVSENLADDLAEQGDTEHEEGVTFRIPTSWAAIDSDQAGYGQTRDFARILSIERTAQLFEQRGIHLTGDLTGDLTDHAGLVEMANTIDTEAWDRWKGDSHNNMSSALQLAAARELGGQERFAPEREAQILTYAENYVSGGFPALQAYTRAKWETTQYVLEQANMPELSVYRGIMLDAKKDLGGHVSTQVAVPDSAYPYYQLPTLSVLRNGLASFSVMPSIANNWNGIGNRPYNPTRVVIRAVVPRTAVLSVPVYGQNEHNEQEVVVAGTAWKAWDVWKEKAPPVTKYVVKGRGPSQDWLIHDGATTWIDLTTYEAALQLPHWLSELRAEPVKKFNPNHDEKGRFASADSSGDTGERTNTPAFKAWFRQSKVVNAQGDPLVVYRGDRPGKTVFTGREDPTVYIQGNVFFSDSPAIGKFYTRFRTNSYLKADDLNESHGLYRAHLSLQHPLIVDAKEEGWDAIPFRGGRIQIDDLALKAQGEGYDGLIVRNVYDQAGLGTQFAAFKPEQIKSVNNRGTYGRTNPDISKDYDESQHPRDEKGLWTTADGGAPLQLTGPPPTKGPSYMTGPATREALEAPLRAAGVRIGNVDDLTDKTIRELDVREHEIYTTDDVLAAQGVADGLLLAREDSSVLAAVKEHMREVPIVFMDVGTHGQMITCLQNGKAVIIVNLRPEKMLRLHHFASNPTAKNTVATDIAAKVYKEKGMEAAIRAEHQASIWHEMGHVADVISGRDYTNLVTDTLDKKFPMDYFGNKASRWAFNTISHYASTKSVEAAAELFVKVQARQRLPPTMKPVMDALLQ